MSLIDKKLLDNFIKLAGEKLEGDWVVIGGTVLPLMGVDYRVTMDIDVAGPKSSSMSQSLVLFEIAEELGLPVETINQAGAYFLHKIENWKENIIVLHKGQNATIFRPDVTLFILLKISRLTESDYLDCIEFLNFSKQSLETPNTDHLISEISKQLINSDLTNPKHNRLIKLKEKILNNQ